MQLRHNYGRNLSRTLDEMTYLKCPEHIVLIIQVKSALKGASKLIQLCESYEGTSSILSGMKIPPKVLCDIFCRFIRIRRNFCFKDSFSSTFSSKIIHNVFTGFSVDSSRILFSKKFSFTCIPKPLKTLLLY